MHVVICGAGVIGTSIAYFLTRRGAEVTVVERASVACAASGKSGGFLALDWCDGSPLAPLARRSFALHGDLAENKGGDWGYRRLDTFGLLAGDRRDFSSHRHLPTPAWLGDETAVHGQLGTEASTAQVHPGDFTKVMMSAAEAGGARLRLGTVDGVILGESGARAAGVLVDGEALTVDAVVIAMGPWSILACRWLPLPAVHGLKGHSFVFRYQPPDGPRALFVEYEAARGEVDAPEVFPRTDGTTYVCGARGHDPLPVDPERIDIEAEPADRLFRQIQRFAPDLAASEILASQACYRPLTEDGLPLIGAVPGVAGAYIATGHSVWGILNAPATGEAMTELLLDGEATLDLSAFDPARLRVLRYASGDDRLALMHVALLSVVMDMHSDNAQFYRLDVVDTGRRRRWAVEEKVRIVEESLLGHRPASSTARRHGISRSILFKWRKDYREGRFDEAGLAPGFMPALVIPDEAVVGAARPGDAGRMEIVVGAGRRVIVGADVDAAALSRVLGVLEPR